MLSAAQIVLSYSRLGNCIASTLKVMGNETDLSLMTQSWTLARCYHVDNYYDNKCQISSFNNHLQSKCTYSAPGTV